MGSDPDLSKVPSLSALLRCLQHSVWLFTDFQCLSWREASTWAGSQSVVTVLINASF